MIRLPQILSLDDSPSETRIVINCDGEQPTMPISGLTLVRHDPDGYMEITALSLTGEEYHSAPSDLLSAHLSLRGFLAL